MTVTDEYLANNEAYARTFTGPLPLPPSRHVAVVACMDARIAAQPLVLHLHPPGLPEPQPRVQNGPFPADHQ